MSITITVLSRSGSTDQTETTSQVNLTPNDNTTERRDKYQKVDQRSYSVLFIFVETISIIITTLDSHGGVICLQLFLVAYLTAAAGAAGNGFSLDY